MQSTLTIILAGGVGSRLSPLTDERTKPAVVFGGKYKIVDFTLTNCLHSGMKQILVLTQYKSHSLQEHLRDGWSIFNPELGGYISVVPPQMQLGDGWYTGTANAIYQALWLLESSEAEYIVVLSGDHIYRMDYAPMLQQHKDTDADLTIACIEVARDDAKAYGVMSVDDTDKILSFKEKPNEPDTIPSNPSKSLASMGIYIFKKEVLIKALTTDARDPDSTNDFGHDLIPELIKDGKTFSYRFGRDGGRVSPDAYWRDVGTIDSYFEANMDLIKPLPPLNLYQNDWPIRTYEPQLPPARCVTSASYYQGIFINSMICDGVILSGGYVVNSILSPNVIIRDATTVNDCILFDNVEVGERCVLKKCIIDKHVKVPDGMQIGVNHEEDAKRFIISKNGVVVVPKRYQFE